MKTSIVTEVGFSIVEDRDQEISGIVLARDGLADVVRDLSEINNLRFLWAVARQWLVIGLAVGAAIWSGHWSIYILAMFIVSTRQHALGILMHDGTHFRCLSNRAWNDAICDLFCALPIGMTTARYRSEHLLHHRFLNTEKDPYWMDFKQDADWHWPKKPMQSIWVFARDLLCLNVYRNGRVFKRWSPWSNHFSRQASPPPLKAGERIRLYAFLPVIITFLTLTASWQHFFLLWMLPLMTLTMAMMRLRTIGEHLAIPDEHELNATRHTEGTLLERLAICPLNINYHIAHHLFASVPYYNLPKLHKILLQNEHYQKHARINQTYLGSDRGLLSEIIQR